MNREFNLLNTYYLKILVEDLYKNIEILSEGTEIKNLNEVKQQMIEKFIEELSDTYKKISNYKEIVLNTLEQLENREKWKQ